jgi:chromosome segregation ATPase
MSMTDKNLTAFSDQINNLIAENRRLKNKSDADDKTIHVLKEQYNALQAGVEDMVEDHRKIERELVDQANRHKVSYTEIDGVLMQAADLIMQAARARIGNATPAVVPTPPTKMVNDHRLPDVRDDRLPIARLAE